MESNVKERPILFSAPMVRAILGGHKTQTRRVVKRQPSFDRAGVTTAGWTQDSLGNWCFPHVCPEVRQLCPYGKPGDHLWVRETWRKWENGGRQVAYAADHKCYEVEFSDGEPVSVWDDGFTIPADITGYKPSIHMPRWASRITVEIVGVRVERIQDISKADCIAEGMTDLEEVHAGWHQSYAQLWDKINSERGFGWEVNPWVWVIEFKVLSDATAARMPVDSGHTERGRDPMHSNSDMQLVRQEARGRGTGMKS